MDIRTTITAIVVTTLSICLFYASSRVVYLKGVISDQKERVVQLEADFNKCSDINTANLEVVSALRNDKKKADDLIAGLNKKRADDKKKLDSQIVVIQASSDTTPPAPILRESVEYIIKGRL